MITTTKEDSICLKMSQKIYSDVIDRNIQPGTKLMPINELAKKFNVSYLTAQRAVKLLQQKGVIESRRGDGTYVANKVMSGAVLDELTENRHTTETAEQNSRPVLTSVGVVMPYWMSDHGAAAFHKITRGFLNGIGRRDWRIELISNEYREAALPGFVDKILQKKLSGILWMAPQIEHQMNMMRLVDKGVLVVSVGRRFPDLPINSIFADLADLACSICDKYCHPDKKVILLTGPTEGAMKDENSSQFIRCFQEKLQEKGGELNQNQIGETGVFNSGFSTDTHILKTLTLDFLKHHADAQVIICYHDEFLSIIAELDNENFWKYPDQSRVININADFGMHRDTAGRIPVTLVHMPLENLGLAAALEFRKAWEADKCESVDLKPTID